MAMKLSPAHRTRDGQPIKTTDIARTPKRPRTGDRVPTPAHAGDRVRDLPARARPCRICHQYACPGKVN